MIGNIIDDGIFNRPIMTYTKILVHSGVLEQGISVLFRKQT